MTKPELGTFQCGLRLLKLRASLDEAEGLLVVSGLDGQYNIGCSQAIGHVLDGISNRDAADSYNLGGSLEETILLLKRNSVLAYASDTNAAGKLRDLISDTCSDLQIFIPNSEEAADLDKLEEHKIASLVQMLRGLQILAIPYGLPDQVIPANPMQLERWPLLQAFGLEGVGRGGFFTQNFKVMSF